MSITAAMFGISMSSAASISGVAWLSIGLTRRQREVVRLVSRGPIDRQAAERLCIAPCVVAEHLTTVYAGLANQAWFENNAGSKRYALIRLLNGFFERQPEIDG